MKHRSIRFKMTLMYSLALIVILGLALVIFYFASALVLHQTVRDYLMGVVEANVDDISFNKEKSSAEEQGNAPVYVVYEDGYLCIDDDFMNNMNDVYAAIYTKDGKMLYGNNPLARVTEDVAFSESHVWQKSVDKVDYTLYDRKIDLSSSGGGEIWMRGIVADTEIFDQLHRILRIVFYILPLLIFAAIALGYFLAGRMLSPIRSLGEMAGKISGGQDLNQRLDIGNKNDEIGKLAEVFNEMLAKLKASFDTEKQFTSDASHELRTPMSVILAQCEYSLSGERTNEEYREALEVIDRQGERMKAMVNDMLAYTRMDQRSEQYTMEEIDLSAVVRDVVEHEKLIASRGITLEAQIDDGICMNGSELLLGRMLNNLINNAYQYGRDGGHVLVTLKKEVPDGMPEAAEQVLLSVADDGIGIAREEQEKIFDRFYRCDSSRTTVGTGLGLSMVKKIAELHCGRIELTSVPGEGSEFRIWLPL